MAISYEKDTDYAKKIAAAKAAGQDTSALEDSRAAKITDASDEQRKAWGLSASEIAAAQERLKGPALPAPVDNTGMISGMFDAQLAAQKAALDQATAQGVSNYQGQIESAPGTYQPMRDQVDVGTNRNIQAQNEIAAAKGTAFSGGVQSDIGGIKSGGEAQKTTLNTSEINFVNNLKKAIADLKTTSSFEQQKLIAENTAAKNAALINEGNRVFEGQYRQASDTFNQGIATAGLTGNYNGTRTLQGQSLDQSIKNDQRQADQWLKTFDYQKERDNINDGQWLKNFEQNKADAAASRAISWGNLKLNRDQFNWSKDPQNPDNIYKVSQQIAKDAEIEAIKNGASAEAAAAEAKLNKQVFDEAWDMIGATIRTYDADTGQYVEKPRFTPEDVGKLIDASDLSDEAAYLMRQRLQIPDPQNMSQKLK